MGKFSLLFQQGHKHCPSLASFEQINFDIFALSYRLAEEWFGTVK
jgi:hypothetical protein